MTKVLVSIYSWENPKLFSSSADSENGSKVIVPTEYGNELGIVVSQDVQTQDEPQQKIIRLATDRDISAYDKYEEKKEEYLKTCHEESKKINLPIKVIDARTNLDGRQTIFVFTADGRVDFRELVKTLSKELKRTIRMQQIGSRDEARKLGGYGICGRELCCVSFPGSIPSITTDMARIQQISHRGTERISGLCGRLMCCLAYEADQYKKLLEGLPEIWSVVNTPEGKGTVIEINAVSQEIKVKTENGKYLILKKEDIK
jgi:cell fate regulator YaaT (PSP1 superfamily)